MENPPQGFKRRNKNLGGDSNVVAYELGQGSIPVEFATDTFRTYFCDSTRPGENLVVEMQFLDLAGQGLIATFHVL